MYEATACTISYDNAKYVTKRLFFFLSQTVGKYMIEIWKAAGMDMNNVEYLWASEEVKGRIGTTNASEGVWGQC